MNPCESFPKVLWIHVNTFVMICETLGRDLWGFTKLSNATQYMLLCRCPSNLLRILSKFMRISMDNWTNSIAQGLMNIRTIILPKQMSIFSHFIVETMCYSNLVVISPNQQETSAVRSTHRQCLEQTSYIREQLINMSKQLKSSKYGILPFTSFGN